MQCCCCGKKDFKQLINFGKFPYINTAVKKTSKIKNYFKDLKYNYCKYCKHIIITPEPNFKKLDLLYKKFYNYNSPLLEKKIKPIRDIFFLNYFNKWIEKHKYKNNFYEIGCFDGYIMHKLKKTFKQTEGCDPSNGADIAKKNNLNVKKIYFNSKNLPNNKFDVVLSRHVIEHLSDPNKFISNIDKITHKNSTVVIETPNFDYYLKKNKTECFSFQHISCFNIFSLQLLFKKHGFICFKKKVGQNIIVFFKKSKNLKIKVKNNIILQNYSNYKSNIIIQKDNFKKIFSIKDEKFVVWGTGGYAITLIYLLLMKLEKISFFIDTNKSNSNKKFIGINKNIRTIDYAKSHKNKYNTIIIASMYYSEIISVIKKFRLAKKVIIFPGKIINL